jgi:hypothetical protein
MWVTTTMDECEEELDRWIHRTYARLAELPAGSQQKRQLASAIRGMEREQLRRRIHRAHTELRHLPPGSDERRKLAQALDEMEDEYSSRQAWIRAHLQESSEGGGPIKIVAEAREALQRASFYLAHPTADATLGEAIAEIERVLARLKEYHGRTPER